jgi:hypothetical protein
VIAIVAPKIRRVIVGASIMSAALFGGVGIGHALAASNSPTQSPSSSSSSSTSSGQSSTSKAHNCPHDKNGIASSSASGSA